MRPFALLLCLAAPSLGFAQQIDLPQDQGKPYLTIFCDPNDSRCTLVQQWFASDAKLRSIRDRAHFNVINVYAKVFSDRYAQRTPKALHIRIQYNEQPVCEIAASEIPPSPELLYQCIFRKVQEWRSKHLRKLLPDEKCDCPDQVTPPKEDPPVQPVGPVQPIFDEHEPAPSDYPSLWVVLGAIAVGGSLGVGKGYYLTHVRG